MTSTKNKNLIPHGMKCVDDNGILCPYYNKLGVIKLDKNNCEFSNNCKKDCNKEKCKNVFVMCTYKDKIESYSNGEFLLCSKHKICGENLGK